MSNKLSLRERLRMAEARASELEQALNGGEGLYTESQVNEIAHNRGAQMVRRFSQDYQTVLMPVLLEVQNIETTLAIIDVAILTATQRRELELIISDLPGRLMGLLAKFDEAQRKASAHGWNLETESLPEFLNYCTMRYQYMTALLSARDEDFSAVLRWAKEQIGSYSGRKLMSLYQDLMQVDRGGAPINAGKRELARRWRALYAERGRRNAYKEALELRQQLMRLKNRSEIETEALDILTELTTGGTYNEAVRKRVSTYRYDLIGRKKGSFSE